MDTLLPQSIRVIELGDRKAYFCGKILSDIGATVVKVERPAGDEARDFPPFYQGKPDRESSLYWWYMNGAKKGITLDLEKPRGQELLKKLVEKTDILIESFDPGYLNGLGLGYERLEKLNPGLIMTSITHFGQTGPYRDLTGSDAVCMALSGVMSTIGEPARQPIPYPLEQAYNMTCIQAAVAIMACYYRRNFIGEGDWVDISVFDSMMRCNYRPPVFWEFTKFLVKREGVYGSGGPSFGGPRVRGIHPTKDGYVCGSFSGGPTGVRDSRPIYEWIKSEGKQGIMDEIDWQGDWAKVNFRELVGAEKIIAYNKIFEDFLATKTKWEVDEAAEKYRIMMTPLLTVADTVKHPQFEARGYWRKVEHPELGERFTYPGQYFLATETENGIRFRAPHIGEHNREIYQGELGLSDAEISSLEKGKII